MASNKVFLYLEEMTYHTCILLPSESRNLRPCILGFVLVLSKPAALVKELEYLDEKRADIPYHLLLIKFMQGRYAKLVLWYEFPTSSIYLTCYISY